ncbi:MAG: thiamine pyrophosphate-dependent dehydrogenase E1 component subunit alpha [Rhodobacterales bacterium]|nr:thiamine pyrophosphate-dependent dehydrogenase E1 component subunit alpha [Rhodobacterales bacterium]
MTAANPDLDPRLRPLYVAMLRLRLIEEAIAERYAGQDMRCPVHLSVGQEAAAVGACAPLRPDDRILSTHRCHGHYLAKGGDLTAMLGEIHGRASGCCGGRGGSMHLFDDDAGVMASVPIVGSSIPLAVGAALAFKQAGDDRVAVAFLGDGSLEEGVAHESLNLAAVQGLPVIFFVENNLYSVYTPLAQRQPDRPLTAIGAAHGLPTAQVDGNAVLAVADAMETAVDRARRGKGPTMIVADTYRWREHCGPNYDNDLGYRTEAEFLSWRDRCPVETTAQTLHAAGQLDDDAILRLTIREEIDAAFTAALAAPLPDPATAGAHVHA